MAKGIYLGEDGIARKVKNMYVGVDSVARKVKKGYIGVDGKAQKFYSSIIETLMAQLFFYLNNFSSDPSSVVSTISGSATSVLADGTRPTVTITTTASKGFRRGSYSSTYGGYDNTCAVKNNIYEDSISDLNDILERKEDERDEDYVVKFRTGTSTSSNVVRTFTFDFKKSRILTLKIYHLASGGDITWYGSNDGLLWETIKSGLSSSTKLTVTNTTPYRYFKFSSPSNYDLELCYMYFTDIQDWKEA